MKTELKKFAFVLLLLAGALTACQTNKEDDSKEVAEEQNEEKFDDKADEKDAQFVVDVVAANDDEIKWANYASQMSLNEEVKSLAKKLANDHSAAVSNLKNIASAKFISFPTGDSTMVDKKMKNWSDKKPSNFDKDWTAEMIDMHKRSIDKLEGGQKEVKDPDIKSWIDSTLPTVRSHLQMIEECNNKLK